MVLVFDPQANCRSTPDCRPPAGRSFFQQPTKPDSLPVTVPSAPIGHAGSDTLPFAAVGGTEHPGHSTSDTQSSSAGDGHPTRHVPSADHVATVGGVA